VCGSRIARVTLELGGKSAAIVLDDFSVATRSVACRAALHDNRAGMRGAHAWWCRAPSDGFVDGFERSAR
jgi:acyl-CoA reductase-like NAD-dependent aldehyde dehydrogenase